MSSFNCREGCETCGARTEVECAPRPLSAEWVPRAARRRLEFSELVADSDQVCRGIYAEISAKWKYFIFLVNSLLILLNLLFWNSACFVFEPFNRHLFAHFLANETTLSLCLQQLYNFCRKLTSIIPASILVIFKVKLAVTHITCDHELHLYIFITIRIYPVPFHS